MTSFHLPVRLTLGLAAAAALLVAVPSIAAAQPAPQSCSVESHTTTALPAGEGCQIIQHEAVIGGNPSGVRVAVIADELECGKMRIDRWSVAKRAAVQACNAGTDASGLKITEDLALVGRHGYLVTVRQTSAGDVGSATGPYATTDISTWDFSTGQTVTLAELLPYDHALMVELARSRFDASPLSSDYLFDPDAFMLTELEGDPVVTFSFPGVAGDAAGKSLDMTLYLPIGVVPRGIGTAPGSDERAARSAIRERVREAACTRAGHIVC